MGIFDIIKKAFIAEKPKEVVEPESIEFHALSDWLDKKEKENKNKKQKIKGTNQNDDDSVSENSNTVQNNKSVKLNCDSIIKAMEKKTSETMKEYLQYFHLL